MARLLGAIEGQGDVARFGRNFGKGRTELADNLCLQGIGHGKTGAGMAATSPDA